MKTTVINKYLLLYNSIYSTRWYVVMWHQTLYFLQNQHNNNSIYSTRWYVVMWHQTLYFLQNLVITLLLLANNERSSSERPMEGGIADETFMPPLKCERFDSAA